MSKFARVPSRWNRLFNLELWVFWPPKKAHVTMKDTKKFSPFGARDVFFIQLKTCSQAQHPTAAKKEGQSRGECPQWQRLLQFVGQQPRRLLFLGIDYNFCSFFLLLGSWSHNTSMPLLNSINSFSRINTLSSFFDFIN